MWGSDEPPADEVRYDEWQKFREVTATLDDPTQRSPWLNAALAAVGA